MRVRARVIVMWLLLVIATSAALAWRSQGVPNLFLEDDAYFYLQIAWNIGTGRGSTFDGLHVTNGYHLLWMGTLSPTAWAVSSLGFGKPAFAAAACALSLSVAVASAIAAFRSTAERAFVVLLFLFCGVTMESTLVGALVLVAGRLFLGEIQLGWLGVAAIAALIPLARIDYAWAMPALALIAAGDRRQPRAVGVAPVLLGTVVGVAAHLGLERALFDSWSSVSSAYKADLFRRHGIGLLLDNVRQTGNQLRYFLVVAMTMVAALGWWQREHRRELLAIGVGLAPIVSYTLINFMRDWYFLPGLLLLALLGSRSPKAGTSWWPRVVTLGSVVVGGTCCGYLALNEGDWSRTAAFVRAANLALPGDSIVFQVDGTGFTGWSLNAPVVNGDGLVNSWAYRDRLLKDDLESYVRDIHATHVITNGPLRSPLLSHHGVTVSRDTAELVADAGPTRNNLVHYRLYRLTRQ